MRDADYVGERGPSTGSGGVRGVRTGPAAALQADALR
jgi:hypothetical protein